MDESVRPGSLKVGSLTAGGKKHHPEVPLANALVKEGDRGCVLVGCAYLEFILERLLREHLTFEAKRRPHFAKSDIDLIEGLLNPKSTAALLGSGWAKSTIAYSIGLINRFAYEGYDRIRKARIECAHYAGGVELDDSLILDLLNTIEKNDLSALAEINGAAELFLSGRESLWSLVSGHRNFTAPRIKFMQACVAISTPMSFALMRYTHPGVTAYQIGTSHSSPNEVFAVERYTEILPYQSGGPQAPMG